MAKSGVEYLAQHPGWKTKKVQHGVYIRYGLTEIKLSANDLELIADALDIVNPDTDKQRQRAHTLSMSFTALSEYAASLKDAKPKRRLPERFGPGYPKSKSNPNGY
jgi:hypothetical protein